MEKIGSSCQELKEVEEYNSIPVGPQNHLWYLIVFHDIVNVSACNSAVVLY
jgi:hypothetical protein